MRDFVDMYYLSRELGLADIVMDAREKYQGTGYSELHFLRSLFEEADASVAPTMLVEWDWDKIKKYFEIEVGGLSRKWGI